MHTEDNETQNPLDERRVTYTSIFDHIQDTHDNADRFYRHFPGFREDDNHSEMTIALRMHLLLYDQVVGSARAINHNPVFTMIADEVLSNRETEDWKNILCTLLDGDSPLISPFTHWDASWNSSEYPTWISIAQQMKNTSIYTGPVDGPTYIAEAISKYASDAKINFITSSLFCKLLRERITKSLGQLIPMLYSESNSTKTIQLYEWLQEYIPSSQKETPSSLWKLIEGKGEELCLSTDVTLTARQLVNSLAHSVFSNIFKKHSAVPIIYSSSECPYENDNASVKNRNYDAKTYETLQGSVSLELPRLGELTWSDILVLRETDAFRDLRLSLVTLKQQGEEYGFDREHELVEFYRGGLERLSVDEALKAQREYGDYVRSKGLTVDINYKQLKKLPIIYGHAVAAFIILSQHPSFIEIPAAIPAVYEIVKWMNKLFMTKSALNSHSSVVSGPTLDLWTGRVPVDQSLKPFE
jgi:hypothetical protein